MVYWIASCTIAVIFSVYVYCEVPTEYKENEHFMTFTFTNLTFTHAEGPVWDPDINTLYWVDVHDQKVHSLNYDTRKHTSKHIPYGQVNIVLPIKNSKCMLVSAGSKLYLFDWEKTGDNAFRFVAEFDTGFPDNILNEGKADALGRFWGGTKGRQIGHKVANDQGTLYSLEAPDFIPQVQVEPVSISNGLVWSLNNTVMFYIDSHTRKIEAFNFDLEKGRLSRRRTILDISSSWPVQVIPDGMTIDKDGLLWVALMFDGCIIRIDPDRRRVIERYKFPVLYTTSITWAGPALDILVVTTSRRNMDPTALSYAPHSGAIFALHQLGTGGVPDNKFTFPNADDYL